MNRESRGNPFILTERLRDLADRGLLRGEAGRWRVDANWLADISEPNSPELPVPFSVREMILGRVGRLAPPARRLLDLAAVIGGPFDLRLLDEAAEEARCPAEQALTTWLSRDLIQPREKGSVSHYDFAHPLIRQVVYGCLPAASRRILHGQVAAALERLYRGREEQVIEALAHHYAQSRHREKALTYLLRAADQMRSRYALEAAAEFYTRALALVPHEDRMTRYRVLARRERVYNQLARREPQAEDLTALLVLARALEDPSRQAEVLRRRAEWAMRTAHFQQGIADAEKAREMALSLGRPGLAADSLRLEAMCHHRRADYGEARRCCEKGVELSRETEDRRREALCLGTLGIVELDQNDLRAAREHMEAAQEFWKAVEEPWRWAIACNNLSMLYHRMGEYGPALKVQMEARRLIPEAGDLALDAHSLTSLGILHHAVGRYEEALACYEEALELARLVSDRRFEGYTRLRWGHTLCALGETEEAEEMYRRALHIQREKGPLADRGAVLEGLARCRLAREDADEALAFLEEAERSYEETGEMGLSVTLALRARAHLSQGEENQARGALTRFHELVKAERSREQPDPAVWWMVSEIWRDLGEKKAAQEGLQRAYRDMQRRAETLEEGEPKQRFLEAVPAHRQILRAGSRWIGREWRSNPNLGPAPLHK